MKLLIQYPLAEEILMLKLVKIMVIGSLLAGVGAAPADEVKPEDAVKYRQSVYTVIKWNFAPMGAMMKGEKPYDKDAFARHAERVAALAPMLLEGYPKGSDMVSETNAKPEIWEQWDKFKGGMDKLQSESAKLAEVAKTGDMAKIKPQFGETAKICKACHDDFRQE
jgi:cytochrome c556